MKIKMIAPRMTLRPMDSKFKRVMSPSVALLVLAALTPSEHQVEVEDENVKEINLQDHPDLVGISVKALLSSGAVGSGEDPCTWVEDYQSNQLSVYQYGSHQPGLSFSV